MERDIAETTESRTKTEHKPELPRHICSIQTQFTTQRPGPPYVHSPAVEARIPYHDCVRPRHDQVVSCVPPLGRSVQRVGRPRAEVNESMHVSKNAPVVCDDALERLLQLQLTVLFVELHEDLLQAQVP